MNIQEIDKWLDGEYGCSYTKLEELHNFLVEQDMKHQDQAKKEIERLNSIINKIEYWLLNEAILEFYNDKLPIELVIENGLNKLKECDK